MSFGICLISAGLEQPSVIGSLLEECGLSVWTPTSPNADDGYIYERAICVVLDMPGNSGVRTLQLLRDYGVKTPALLVVDSGYVPGPADLKNAWVLDVIPRTSNPRKVLRWIESMCITQKLVERLRSVQSGDVELLSA
jgi:FixJ family two-component response regulator